MTNQELLDEYFSVFKLRGYSKNTINNYSYDFNMFLDFIEKNLLDVTTTDIRGFLAFRSESIKKSTLVNKINILKSLFSFLTEEGYMEENPTDRIQKPSFNDNERRYLKLEEIEQIRIDVKDNFKIMLFELLYSSGIRVSEAYDLNWEDIDFYNREILVKHGKGDKARVTKMSIRAKLLLERYKNNRSDNHKWVLQSNYNQRMSTESIQRHIGDVGNIVNLEIKLTPHKLRHSFATTLSRRNTPIEVIQELLGHTDINTTKRYIEVNRDNVDYSYNQAFI